MREAEFKTLPVRKVFINLAVPSILSMVFSSIYLMADGVFVGRFIGSHALAAVNLVMPLVMVIFALSDMIAVGASVKVAIAMGEQKNQKAKSLFTASVLMIIGIGFIFSIVGIFFLDNIIFGLIKDDILAKCAYDYVKIFLVGLPFIMPLFAMDNYLRTCGKAKYSMWVNIILALLNILLDWIFIAKMGLGIEFSAIASVISMFIGSIFSFVPFFSKKITLHFTKPKITFREIKGIIYNGSSEFFGSIAGSFIATAVNGTLLALGGAMAVASYGIIMYIDSLLVGILYGITDGIQPAVSYNLGAKEVKRGLDFFKISCIVTGSISLICMAGIMIFPESIAAIFAKNNDGEIIKMTTIALMMFAPSYLFTWFNTVASAFLTAMDKPKESMIIMGFRAIIFPLICLVVLTKFMGVYGVFLAAVTSGGLTFIIALLIWKHALKELKG